MTDFFRRGVEQDVPVFGRTAATPCLEEILQADADLAFHAADRLLQLTREEGIRLFDVNRILQAFVKIIHAMLRCCVGGGTWAQPASVIAVPTLRTVSPFSHD